ncbi:Beta-monoglucosyldiacylglycerol synthase [Halotydeus destructor]|nr:Beta-monoglucosyldiacylglycerol synthase [Halotydeus destructor]
MQSVVHLFAICHTFFVIANCVLNCITFSTLNFPISKTGPKVSILVPARNEERFIFDCITSLANQRYNDGDSEILVMDDHSSDNTFDIVSKMAAENDKIRVFRSNPLPSDWLGKAHALDQLVKMATGDFLFQVDSDTVHRPQSLSFAMSAMSHYQCHLVSGSARYEMPTLAERLTLPLGYFNFILKSYIQINWLQIAIDGCAYGYYMCVNRKSLEKIGGMSTVQKLILDDYPLAVAMRRHGFRTIFLPVGRHILHRSGERYTDYYYRYVRTSLELVRHIWLPIIFYICSCIYMAYLPVRVLVDLFLGHPVQGWSLFVSLGLTAAWTTTAILHHGFSPIFAFYPIYFVQMAAIFVHCLLLSLVGGSLSWRQRRVSVQAS